METYQGKFNLSFKYRYENTSHKGMSPIKADTLFIKIHTRFIKINYPQNPLFIEHLKYPYQNHIYILYGIVLLHQNILYNIQKPGKLNLVQTELTFKNNLTHIFHSLYFQSEKPSDQLQITKVFTKHPICSTSRSKLLKLRTFERPQTAHVHIERRPLTY